MDKYISVPSIEGGSKLTVGEIKNLIIKTDSEHLKHMFIQMLEFMNTHKLWRVYLTYRLDDVDE